MALLPEYLFIVMLYKALFMQQRQKRGVMEVYFSLCFKVNLLYNTHIINSNDWVDICEQHINDAIYQKSA